MAATVGAGIGAAMGVEFRLLGQVEAHVDGVPVDLGHLRQRGVLAALLVDANRPVPVDALLDRVWGDRLPQRGRNTVAGYMSRLRGLFAAASGVAFARRAEGYLLTVDPEAVDLHRFRRLVAEAREAADDPMVADLLDQALARWRGDAFTALDTPWFNAERALLNADRLAATLDHNDALLRLGRHAELPSELSRLADAHPLDERLAAQLMLTQYRCGRQADALRHYELIRTRLADELGADPGAQLRGLHQQILTGDPALVDRRSTRPAGAATPSVPRQLPPSPASFVARASELARLDNLLGASDELPAAVLITVLSGTAGVGKTSLAVHWAYQIVERFPDGQLYVNLHGFGAAGSVADPGDAIRAFLNALNVPAPRIPTGLEAQAGLYRSLVADKRMLIVLDNARDSEQIRPLLPGAPGCLIVVTSRNQLTGLVTADGAYPIILDLLTPDEARQLLAHRLGADRVHAVAGPVDEIITRCARLPLALAIVAARAATYPEFPLEQVAAQLRRGLDMFDGGDPATDVRAVFSWSYHALTTEAARLFRLLGLHPGPDISAPAAASLAGQPVTIARRLLAELTRGNLLTEHAPDRYAFHDLLRAYAAEVVQATETESERREAVRRMLDHYLHTARVACQIMDPYRGDLVTLGSPEAGVTPEHVGDEDAAMAWFSNERTVLSALVGRAAQGGFEAYTWQLAWTLSEYLHRRGYWREHNKIYKIAATVADQVGDELGQALAHCGLGSGYILLGRYDEAEHHLCHALKLFDELGIHVGAAVSHRNLGVIYEHRARHREALIHAERALARYRAAGYRAGEIRALNAVGWRHAILGDYEQARSYCQLAIPQYQETGDRMGEAATWDSLGYVHHRLGEYEQALTCFQRAIDVFRDIGNRHTEALTLRHMGDTHEAMGASDAAADAWRQALEILEQLGHSAADQVRAKLAS